MEEYNKFSIDRKTGISYPFAKVHLLSLTITRGECGYWGRFGAKLLSFEEAIIIMNVM